MGTYAFHNGYQAAMTDIANILERTGDVADVREWVINNSTSESALDVVARLKAAAEGGTELAEGAACAKCRRAQDDPSIACREHGAVQKGAAMVRAVGALQEELHENAVPIIEILETAMDTALDMPVPPVVAPVRFDAWTEGPGAEVADVADLRVGDAVLVRAFGSWRSGRVLPVTLSSDRPMVWFRMADGSLRARRFDRKDIRATGQRWHPEASSK